MTDKNDSWQRSQQHRKHIRRMELNSYFQERRLELLSMLDSSSFLITFSSIEEQESFLDEASRELTGDPKPEWMPTVSRLRKAVYSFKGELDSWFKTSIIRSLQSALQIGCDVGLIQEVLQVLIDLAYSSVSQNNNGFTRRFLEYQPVEKILALATYRTHPLHLRLQAIMLLSKMVIEEPKNRIKLLQCGAGSVLVEQGCQLQALIMSGKFDKEALRLYLLTVYGFVKTGKSAQRDNFIKSTMIALVKPMMGLFMIDLQEQFLKACMESLIAFLKSDSTHIYSSIYNWVGFPDKVIQLLYSEDSIIRIKAIYMLGYISYCSNPQYCEDLLSRGILDRLWQAYRRFTTYRIDFTKQAIIIMSNCADSQSHAEMMAIHPIISLPIAQMNGAQAIDVQEESFWCLRSILQKVRYETMKDMIRKHDLLKPAAMTIINCPLDAKLTLGAIDFLQSVIDRSLNVVYQRDFEIMQTLERYYNISHYVENIVDKSANKILTEAAKNLVNTIHENIMQSNQFV